MAPRQDGTTSRPRSMRGDGIPAAPRLRTTLYARLVAAGASWPHPRTRHALHPASTWTVAGVAASERARSETSQPRTDPLGACLAVTGSCEQGQARSHRQCSSLARARRQRHPWRSASSSSPPFAHRSSRACPCSRSETQSVGSAQRHANQDARPRGPKESALRVHVSTASNGAERCAWAGAHAPHRRARRRRACAGARRRARANEERAACRQPGHLLM